MNKADRKGFYQFILGIAEVYDKKMTDAAVAIYWDTLKDLPIEKIRDAVKSHIEDPERGRFMPKPADIRYYGAVKAPSAEIALASVIETMEKLGAYSSVFFEDQAINAVIRDMGGWPGFCREWATAPTETWIEKKFKDKYREYSAHGRYVAEVLVGISDADNKNRGYLEYVKDPVFIQSAQELPALQAGKPVKELRAPDKLLLNE